MDIKLICKHGRMWVHPDCESVVTDQPPWRRHAIHQQLCRAVYTQEQKPPPTGERELAESGVAIFPGLLETGEATDLSQQMGGAIAVKREDADPTQAAASDKEAGTEFITFDATLRAAVTLTLPRILNETVTAALERYFGSYFRIDYVRMYRTFPLADALASFHWHRDCAPMAQLHIMVYLTDSGVHSGSTSFLDLEQTRAAAQAGYSFPNMDERIAEIDKVFAACRRPPDVNRPELAAGDAVAFASPRVLHRGHSPETGFRDVLLLVLLPSFVPWSQDIDNFGSDYMFIAGSKNTLNTNPYRPLNPSTTEADIDKSMIELWVRDGALFAPDIAIQRDHHEFAEAQWLAEQFIAKKPDVPGPYACLHEACYELGGSREVVRNHLRTMAKHCNVGYHYQPGITVSLKDRYPELATELAVKRIRVDTKPPLTGKPQLTMAEVVTDQATLIGTSGLTLNGSVGGTTLPTRYRFRYGTASDNLDKTTELKFVPPGRHGRVRDDGANLYHRVYCYSFQVDFRKIESDRGDAPEPRLGNVAMVLLSPFGKDRNHINGIGIVDLLLGWTNAAQVRDQVGSEYTGETHPQKVYPGEELDLRDAELEVVLRSAELDARDFRLVAWFHANTGTALFPDKMEDLVPWVLTASLDRQSIAPNGEWQTLRYQFRNNTNDWSFGGNNVEEKGEHMARYRYYPLNDSLRCNRGNICLCFVCGQDIETPDGEIELASLSLRYRSRSLLSPGYGAELVAFPSDGTADPTHLTAGAIGIDNECWQSCVDPETPQEFTWKFTQEASLESVRLFQHPRWPAKEIEVLASDDGERFTVIWSAELQSDAAEIAATRIDHKTRILASITILDSQVKCRFLKLRILSGHRSEHWGLDAIEAFGEGPLPLPEIEPCSFSEELSGMDPGTIVYYQIVAENDAGTSEGTIESFQVPVDRTPIIHWARVIERMAEKATVLVRLTPMGSFTDLNGCFHDADGELVFEGKVVAGRWDTPKHVTMAVTGLDVGQTYRGVLTAANDAGESDDIEICIEPEIDVGI